LASPHRSTWRRAADKLREELRAREVALVEKDAAISVLTARVNELEHQVAVLKKQILGPKTERMPTPDDEAKKRNGDKPKRGGYTGASKRKQNAAVLAGLPTTIVEHPIPESERRCASCGEDVCAIGKGEVSYEWEWIPGRFIRKKHVVETGRCPCKQHYRRGPAPARVDEGCTYGPGLIAKLVVDKCGDAIPIYRVEKQMRRSGIPLSRSTMNGLLLRAADLLEPLYDVALGELRIDPQLQADETSFRTQGQRERVFVWAFLSPLYTLYVYSPSRSGDTPKKLLDGTTGSLTCDGYSGYNVVTNVDGRTRAGCWCHARRKLFEALPSAPEARGALELIIDLFLVEREAVDAGIVGAAAHLGLRRTKSARVLGDILLWMKETAPLYEPSSAMGKAIGYMINQWWRLTAFTDDPCIPIHNNASESALRIIAMARKLSLFFGNDEAGRRLVILYSLVSTCEKSGVNPEVYIRDVLMRLPDWSKDRVAELLPHRWKERFGTGFAAEQVGKPAGNHASETNDAGSDAAVSDPAITAAAGAPCRPASAPPPADAAKTSRAITTAAPWSAASFTRGARDRRGARESTQRSVSTTTAPTAASVSTSRRSRPAEPENTAAPGDAV
jgi:transposase